MQLLYCGLSHRLHFVGDLANFDYVTLIAPSRSGVRIKKNFTFKLDLIADAIII